MELVTALLKQRMEKGGVYLRYIIVNTTLFPSPGQWRGVEAAGRKGEARFETFNPLFDHL